MNLNFSLPSVFSNFGDFSTALHRSSNMPVKNSSLKSDVFVKTTGTSDAAPVSAVGNTYNEAYLRQLYDEVYDFVVKELTIDNPEISQLNLSKPEFVIEDLGDDGTLANYSFNCNQLRFNAASVNDDIYAFVINDENGNPSSLTGVSYTKNKFDELKKYYKDNGINAVPVKLDGKDKETFIKATFAHELRHFIQTHLVAATEGCREKYIEQLTKRDKECKIAYAEYEKVYDELRESDPDASFEKISKPDSTYGLSYKPEILLPPDTKLKFSLFPGDNRYLSVAKDLLPAEIIGLNGIGTASDSSYEDYFSSVLELDAHNFQYEYLMKNIDKTSPNFEIMAGICCDGQNKINNGINIAKNKGICSLENF